ncbi:hypothetical protein [Microbacter margulisiae]|uniref:Uncharacterized protein n=1 Tax=Microbacter margulisiae TaxID=1350067 RepID=A0A7W5DUT6_9PORP|nr:hypothetical protein [Microbacter margulisiae]MBB3188593.1 hypothetical protein [Microbacter margulisiae]
MRHLHYIALGGGLLAIMVRNGGTDSIYYVHPDHLGSFTLVTDQDGNGNGENGTNLPTTENKVTVIGQAPKSYNQHSNTSDQGHSWLYPIIGDLDGNRELDSRINRYISSPEEIRREVDAEMEIGMLFLPTDVVGIAASILVEMGYSATEQLLLKSPLYAMEYPKAVYKGIQIGSLLTGAGSGFLGEPYLPTSPDPLPSVNPWFDLGLLLEQDVKMVLDLPEQHDQKK